MNFVYLVSIICLFNCNVKILKADDERRCSGSILFRRKGLRNIKRLSHNVNKFAIPRRFDAREKWPNCKSLFRISDQGRCEGCWAFAATSVMSDRLCIHSKGKIQDYVSTQDLLECCTRCPEDVPDNVGGCKGGYPFEAFKFWVRDGLVNGYDHPLEGCKPINEEIIKGIPQKTCRRECTNKEHKNSYENSKIFGSELYIIEEALKNDLRQVQIELMENGPMLAALNIYGYISRLHKDDVMFYNKTRVREGERGRGHGVKLIGWDETKDGTPVWIIANSWGTGWCDSGFCRLKRGFNDLEFEGYYPMMTGLPKLRSISRKGTNKTEKFQVLTSGSSTIFVSLLIIILEVILLSHIS